MNVVPLRLQADASAPIHAMCVVEEALPDGGLAVRAESGAAYICRRAASCLLRPVAGDTVLVLGPDAQRAFVVAVLEQVDSTVTRIEVDRPLVIGAQDHPITVETGGPVRLSSGTRIEMAAPQWSMLAQRVELQSDDMRFSAKHIDATTGAVKVVGRTFETLADRVTQMARNALRVVEGMDQSRAGHLDYKVSGTARIHGRHTAVTGEELVKVDAAQIHMG